MYVDPILPEGEIEKEKGVIIEEINMYEDLPQRKVWDVMFELLYGDAPVGWSIAGPKENIKNVKKADFIDYRMRHYVSESTTIIVAGKIKEKEVIEKVKKAFDKMSSRKKEDKKKVVENQKEPQIKIHYKDTDQTPLLLVREHTILTINIIRLSG
jgi:predicted Zn-dependent peptidase